MFPFENCSREGEAPTTLILSLKWAMQEKLTTGQYPLMNMCDHPK